MAEPIPPQVSLRALRTHLGLTLDELATRISGLGVSITADGLSNAELGRKPTSEPVLLAWAKALGTDRSLIRTGPELIQLVNAVQAEAGCTCRAGLPRNRRMARTAA